MTQASSQETIPPKVLALTRLVASSTRLSPSHLERAFELNPQYGIAGYEWEPLLSYAMDAGLVYTWAGVLTVSKLGQEVLAENPEPQKAPSIFENFMDSSEMAALGYCLPLLVQAERFGEPFSSKNMEDALFNWHGFDAQSVRARLETALRRLWVSPHDPYAQLLQYVLTELGKKVLDGARDQGPVVFTALMDDEQRAAQEQYGDFHSWHEVLGVLAEEFHEFSLEVYKKNTQNDQILGELVQIAQICRRAAENFNLVVPARGYQRFRTPEAAKGLEILSTLCVDLENGQKLVLRLTKGDMAHLRQVLGDQA